MGEKRRLQKRTRPKAGGPNPGRTWREGGAKTETPKKFPGNVLRISEESKKKVSSKILEHFGRRSKSVGPDRGTLVGLPL